MGDRPNPTFPFVTMPRIDTNLWGVWDRRHWTFVVPPEHEEKAAAERLAVWINEAYAAGFADATIVRSHPRGRLRRFTW